MTEFLIAAVPLLVLVASLLLGRYPGYETALRIADRLASRRCPKATTTANASRPRPPATRAAHGGQLIAFGLAQRPPPLSA